MNFLWISVTGMKSCMGKDNLWLLDLLSFNGVVA